MAAPTFLVDLVRPWADFYADRLPASVTVTFIHFTGLLLAGGSAVAVDRETLLQPRLDDEGRARGLEVIRRVHAWVLLGLGLSVASGLLLAAADLETYFGSTFYWSKMTLVALLLVNGAVLHRVSTRSDATDPVSWSRLRGAAARSLVLWLAIVLNSILVATAA
jgi:hypothetical protein